ncbi:hypothetical protein [Streptomyces californicus]|uniref:hypothetical protein n=1 Tax=Streptomyces californicus TaxID=67351 RepID=UPI00296ECDF3|nr:hypothetical protein [Streptomyces californicus]MDW4912481.1 hypothetical protein [Streptomyces californicus]
MDTDALLAQVDRESARINHARAQLTLASLGLLAARVRADHPTARRVEMSFWANAREGASRAVPGRVWLPDAGPAGRWRAWLDADARAELESLCVHITPDARSLWPTLWVDDPATGLTVVDLDAVTAAVGRAEPNRG